MLTDLFDLTVFCILTSLTVLLYCSRSARKSRYERLPFPPGPKGFPVIGNLLDMPKQREWVIYREWAKEYGTFEPGSICGGHFSWPPRSDLSHEYSWDACSRRELG